MKPLHVFSVIDSHTAGAATRIVTAGVPRLRGATMAQKTAYFQSHFDKIRASLVLEPRGNSAMSGAFLVEPVHPEADLGVIWTYAGGYHPMCGHGTIGVACAAVELGWVEPVQPATRVLLDMPAGLVPVRVALENGVVQGATFRNVPCFLYKEGVKVELPGVGTIPVDIAYGGDFVVLAETAHLGMELSAEALPRAVELALRLRDALGQQAEVCHPISGQAQHVDMVMISGPAAASSAHYKNLVVSGAGEVDRSPCGVGTSARMAQLHAKGELALGQEFVQEGIIGTLFKGQLVRETTVAGLPAVTPEITAQAFIIGFNQWIIDPADPLQDGFLL